jgi:hypothetical protein
VQAVQKRHQIGVSFGIILNTARVYLMAQVVRSWKMRIVSCTLLVICDSCEILSMIDDLSALTVECRNVITRYLPCLQVPRLIAC